MRKRNQKLLQKYIVLVIFGILLLVHWEIEQKPPQCHNKRILAIAVLHYTPCKDILFQAYSENHFLQVTALRDSL